MTASWGGPNRLTGGSGAATAWRATRSWTLVKRLQTLLAPVGAASTHPFRGLEQARRFVPRPGAGSFGKWHTGRVGSGGTPLRLLPVVVAAVLGFSVLAGQAQDGGPVTQGQKPPMLLSGLGKHTHPIATRNPGAQEFFDQGLTLLYGFNRYEALRSFRRAAELDPEAPMPYWGMAMALGPHINMDLDGDVQITQSCEAVRDGLAVSKRASARERAYLQAVASRCPEYRPTEY